MLERYFREGEIKEIADYCEIDVVGRLPAVAEVRTVAHLTRIV